MFDPKFSETQTLRYQIEEIDRIRFRIERMLIMPQHEHWLQREAFIRTAYSSTMVENASIPEDEMKAAAKPSPLASVPKERPDVANYARALEFVDFLSDSEITADEASIRQIHWLLMKGLHDTKFKPGQYRMEPNWVEDQGVRVYEPPHHIDLPMLMREFAVWLREDNIVSPVLKAGIAHAHLVAIHPFADGNGRAARLLATLLLQKGGYGFRKLLSLDAHYQRNRDEYIGALRKSLGPKFHSQPDLTPWLDFFPLSMIVQAGWLEQRLTDWRMTVEMLHSQLAPLGLNERQVDGLVYAANLGHITRKDYAEITGISLLTATRDLAGMVAAGYLSPVGVGRNRKYVFRPPGEGEQGEAAQPNLL